MEDTGLPDSVLEAVMAKYGWDAEIAKQKIVKTQEILGFQSLEEAAEFLLSAITAGELRGSDLT